MRYVELPLTELVDEDLLPVMEAWLSNDAYCPIGSAEPVWFDIETTGLSSSSACTYMIGAVMRNEAREWTFRQWFAEGPGEEEVLLRSYAEALPENCALLHYNGTTFDIPFLRDRSRYLELDITWPTLSIDLYGQLRRLKSLALLPSCRQRDLEPYAGYTRVDPYDGGTLIRYYGDYVKYNKLFHIQESMRIPMPPHDTDLPYSAEECAANIYETLARHNREDLAGLVSLVRLYDVFDILNGDIGDTDLTGFGVSAVITLMTERRWPKDLLVACPLPKKCLTLPERCFDCIVTVSPDEDGRPTLCVPILTEPAKHFYDNYHDYFYLPLEGRAIHRSIATHMDRKYCRPAKRGEAFDWFRGELLPQVGEVFSPCFLYDPKDACLLFPAKELPKHPEKQTEYAKGILSLFLRKKK
ncbi:MAG: ribonuclease H-like domain-containing protein [Lachnospiraceae bacterium]|nr:ribonuclease H-like domain-containing protein [Lachnospiraceae bacterium]